MAKSPSIPKKVDFPVKQGDTFRRVFTFGLVVDPSAVPPVIIDPTDLTTATFKFIIEGEPDLTLGNGLTLIPGGDNNKVLLSVDITWIGKRKYEFERVLDGVTWTPFAGRIISQTELLED